MEGGQQHPGRPLSNEQRAQAGALGVRFRHPARCRCVLLLTPHVIGRNKGKQASWSHKTVRNSPAHTFWDALRLLRIRGQQPLGAGGAAAAGSPAAGSRWRERGRGAPQSWLVRAAARPPPPAAQRGMWRSILAGGMSVQKPALPVRWACTQGSKSARAAPTAAPRKLFSLLYLHAAKRSSWNFWNFHERKGR